ncbi:MAG: VWA domain-containing protein [Nitrospirae bacterium]|nr:VWA domain-containing protein [Nitrospirota bacterium]
MIDRLLDFIQKLREEGVQVSASELMDAMRALTQVDLLSPVAVGAALETTLVKREADLPAFRKLYNLFFLYGKPSGLHENIPGLDGFLDQLDLAAEDREKVKRLLQKLLTQLSPMGRYLLSTDPRKLEELRELLEDLQSTQTEMADSALFRVFRRPMKVKGYLFDDLRRIEDAMREAGLSPQAIQAVQDELRRLLLEMAQKLEGAFKTEPTARAERKTGEHYLWDRPFFNISEAETREVREILRQLGQYFADVLSRKKYRARTGVPDLRRIMRVNAPHDLIPIQLFMRSKRYNQPELVVICDVSSSVRHAARFMLMFVHQLQRAFRRVHSFLFAGELGESTDLFKTHDLNDAVNLALGGKVINPHMYTDYGHALATFHRDYMQHIRPSTAVLLLGDGRNNYGPAQDWVLHEIRRRSRILVWLNPENPLIWGTGDSLMHLYGHYCQIAAECSTPRHLQKVMEQVVQAL